MRPIFLISCLWACAIAFTARADTPPADAPAVRLVLDLSDGSRVIGAPSIDKLKLTTSYADLEVQLSLMRVLEFKGTDRVAQVTLQNGDLVSGQLAATEIAVKTGFGQIAIPMTMVRTIRVSHSRIGKALPEGCVLHYTFSDDEGGKVTDASGNGNDGTVHGATYVSENKFGGAMSFNGDHQAVMVKNAVSLQLQDFTIMAWIKFKEKDKATKTGTSGIGVVFAGGAAGYGLGINSDGTLLLTNIGADGVSSKLAIHDDVFHHVAVTKKGGKIVFYLDGIADSAPDYNTNFVLNSGLAVGAVAHNLDNSFYGLIDEVAVFNRPLSADEIKGVYGSQK